MNKYTVAELRSKTREVLNVATVEPVLITRYDEEFVLERVITDPQKQRESLKTEIGAVDKKLDRAADGSCVHGAAPGFCKVQKCPNSKRP